MWELIDDSNPRFNLYRHKLFHYKETFRKEENPNKLPLHRDFNK